MKIAQVCPRYYPYIGGVETHVQEISQRLVKRGFEVDVVCTDTTGGLRKRENTKLRVFSGRRFMLITLLSFYGQLIGQIWIKIPLLKEISTDLWFLAIKQENKVYLKQSKRHVLGNLLVKLGLIGAMSQEPKEELK